MAIELVTLICYLTLVFSCVEPSTFKSSISIDQESADFVVAKDGSGHFRKIQDAMDALRKTTKPGWTVVYVKAGVYVEDVVVSKPNIKIFGDGINKTIVTGNKKFDLQNRGTFQVVADGFVAQDITFQNTAGPGGGQAVALYVASHRSAFYRCSIVGNQDTLFTYSGQQFYKECLIFGTVDFIFGDALVVFQDCKILFRKPLYGGGLVATAHGRNGPNHNTGYSFQGCTITAANDLKPVLGHYKKAFLGRPWLPYGRTFYMESFIDEVIDPKGWLDSFGYNRTTYCGEYKNVGPGAHTNKRVQWPGYHVIRNAQIAKSFTVAEFIKGEEWLHETGVPFISGFENRNIVDNALDD